MFYCLSFCLFFLLACTLCPLTYVSFGLWIFGARGVSEGSDGNQSAQCVGPAPVHGQGARLERLGEAKRPHSVFQPRHRVLRRLS